MQKARIVAVPSANDVVIDAPSIKGDRVFVYGDEVDDFRTIDYEGLTALNISATQELGKRMTRQLAEVSARAEGLQHRLSEQAARVAALEKEVAEVAALKAQLAAMLRTTTPAPVALAQP